MRALVATFIFNVHPLDRRFFQTVREILPTEEMLDGWAARPRELLQEQLDKNKLEIPNDTIVDLSVRVSDFEIKLKHLTPGRCLSVWKLEKPVSVTFRQKIRAVDMFEEVVVNCPGPAPSEV